MRMRRCAAAGRSTAASPRTTPSARPSGPAEVAWPSRDAARLGDVIGGPTGPAPEAPAGTGLCPKSWYGDRRAGRVSGPGDPGCDLGQRREDLGSHHCRIGLDPEEAEVVPIGPRGEDGAEEEVADIAKAVPLGNVPHSTVSSGSARPWNLEHWSSYACSGLARVR